MWREQQLKQKQQEAANFLAPDDAVPKKLPLWSPEDEEKKESTEEKQQREAQEQEQRERIQKVVEEIDPLDAYMAGLVDQAAIDQSLANPASNVISLDEIESKQKIDIYGTFLPSKAPTPSNGVKPAQVQTNETAGAANEETTREREAREERELKEFMRAIKEQREKENSQAAAGAANGSNDPVTEEQQESAKKNDTGRIYQGFEEDIIGEDAEQVEQRSALEILQEQQKKKEIKAVDHSQVCWIVRGMVGRVC